MAGILSGLFGYGTDDYGQITSPGLLGNIGRGLQNNSDALMGFGMGMLSGKNGYDNWANAAQLMQQGSASDRQRQVDITNKVKQAAQQKAATQYASQLPENLRGLVMANPDMAAKFASADYEKLLNPDQGQMIERNGKTYRVFKNGTVQEVTGLPGQREELDRQLDAAGITDPAQRQQIYQQKLGLDPAPKYETFENPDGTKQTVQVTRKGPLDPYTGQPAAQQGAGQRNPFAMPGKNTTEQAQNSGYANRMAESHAILSRNEDVNQGSGWLPGKIDNLIGLPNEVKSNKRQNVDQAERNFVNAILRRESGAAISPAEFENARQQYFPQPGDTPQQIEQKRQNRETAIEGTMGGAGPNYTPPDEWKQGRPKYGNKAGKTSSGLSWSVE